MTTPPLAPTDLTRRLKEHNDQLEQSVRASVQEQAAAKRLEAAIATVELKLWRMEMVK